MIAAKGETMKLTVPAAVLIWFATSASAFAGVTYSFESSTTGIAPATLSGSGASDGAKMRIHFTKGDGNMFPDNSLALTTDDGKSLSVVDLGAKTFYVL